MQAHAACARLPRRARTVCAQTGKFVPAAPTIGRAEERGVFHAGIVAAIVRALDKLSEPAAALRCLQAIGFDRRAGDVPCRPPLVGCEHECTLARAD